MFSSSILVMFMLLLIGVVQVSAGIAPWLVRGSAESTHLAISTSLEPTTNWTQRLGQVQDHLAEIKSNRVPTCKRLAAQGLVYSCEKYDATDASATHNTQAELEAFPKLYAIRMTQCALEDAGSSLPSVCKAAQSPSPGRPVGDSDIQTCLSALIQNTNTWTTYSHMNTDGLIMCQAMRVEQSKDEQLHFFQVLLGTTSDISEAMRAIKGDIDQLFSKIGNEMRTFHMELQRDNLESKAAIKEHLDGIQANMNGVSGDVRGLLVAMGEAKQTIHEYTTQFDSALSRAQDWSTQMDNGWATSLTKIRDDFEETRNVYQYQLERYHADFAQRAYAMTNDLETVNSLSSDLLSKLALLNEDLDEPLEKVGVLASQADVVKEKQSAMMAEFKEKGDSILVSLAAASEHAVFVNTWMGAAVGLFLDFRADIKLNILIFSICYPVAGPVVFMGCRQAFGLVAGNLVTLFASFALALWLTSLLKPFALYNALIDSHPALFNEAPPYLSILVIFMTGAFTAILALKLRRSPPVYDPAAQLGTLPHFQDDLDLDEQKQYLGT